MDVHGNGYLFTRFERAAMHILERDFYSLLPYFEDSRFRQDHLVPILNHLYNFDDTSEYKRVTGRFMDINAYCVWEDIYEWYCDYYTKGRNWHMISRLIEEQHEALSYPFYAHYSNLPTYYY